ncbi:MAG: fibro-slime domain-containing protein [Fibrobacter sp.]|nr:fibro-slime domain-containing protein [Fibrobacter sp.]
MKNILFSLIVLILSQQVAAEFTIHILNPWRADTSQARREALRLSGNSEVGHYPGSDMIPEGEGWFVYTYTTLDYGYSMDLLTFIGPDRWYGEVIYPFKLSIDSLLAPYPVTVNELWIMIPDSTKPPLVYDTPPGGKVINIFNPWPDNSPRIISGDNPPLRMYSREDICGWYTYQYPGTAAGLSNIKFTDYFQTKTYSASGMTDGPAIDLSLILASQDTVYILPRPFPFGAPSITATFPGRTGECGYRKVSGLFRDWIQDEVSFFNNPTGMSGGDTTGMVLPVLTEEGDFKPARDPSRTARNAEQLETWFKTAKFSDGSDNDTCLDIMLRKSDDGMWTFDSDWMGGFFMLDSFQNPNNKQYEDVRRRMHNFHFTMEMHLQFIYHQNAGLEFYFRGDDDVWVYVNNRLAIDLGGLHDRARDTLILDQMKDELGLVDGEMYSMDMFYAERNPIGANFMIRTSMDLRNSDELYYKETAAGNGSYQYDVWQRILTEGIGCGTTRLIDEEEQAQVNFFIEGPQFPQDSLVPLPPGTHFGGITTDPNKFRVTIDSTSITGLASGEYYIIFKSTVNKERTGYLTFIVPPKPHHLDILNDSIPFDQKQDAFIDSIFMSIEKDSFEIFAVIRDSTGNFIEHAGSAVWASRNEGILTVHPSATDPSRCTVVKIDGGTTWVVVNANGLKPDSVRIVADARPDYPLVSSALMLDSNGDNIPDLLQVTLSDTFKTGQTLTTAEINYRGSVYSIPSAQCSISERILHVPFTSSYGADGRPSGNVTIIMDVEGEQESHSGPFTDGIGPSLSSADVLENESTDPDIIFLTFSEPLHATTVRGEDQLLLIKSSGDTIPLDILAINHIENDSTVSVLLSSSPGRPLPGDLLRLLPASRGGKISESNGMLPHDLNLPVTIGFRAGAASIEHSWYKDTDADGIIDSVYLRFKRPIQISEFDSLRVQWGSKGYVIDPQKLVRTSDSSFSLFVKNSVVRNDQPLTDGFMVVGIEYKNVPGIIRSSFVTDSAAPVLVSATLHAGRFNISGTSAPDTLVCSYSENILVPGNSPFYLSNNKAERYRPVFSLINNPVTYIVGSYEPPSISPSENDTVWIDISGAVRDTSGNLQLNPANRRVLLKLIQEDPEWIARSGPNPVRLSISGVDIQVMPVMPVPISRYKATITIYDPLGNRIINSDMTFQNRYFQYYWNGYNRRGRKVGNGVYIAQVAVYDNKKVLWTNKINIAVKN